jgi:DNA-binding CsgD family transcriptional regulator
MSDNIPGDPGDMTEDGGQFGADLTPREREVLAMVAAGMTNREIGEALFISESTAGVHVSNLMAKLGVGSRTEAATAAYRAGLVEAAAVAPTPGAELTPAPPSEGRRWGRRWIALVGVGGLFVLAVVGYVVGAVGTEAESPAALATASASAPPTAPTTPSPTPSPTLSPTPTSTPAASPAVHAGFQYHDFLRVEVNGLAVRQAPLLSSPLVPGERTDFRGGTGPVLVDEVRLGAGNLVAIELGPLPIGDTVWYQVVSSGYDPAEVAAGGGPAFLYTWQEASWVAASVGANQYLVLYQRDDPHNYDHEPFGPDGPRVFTVSGTGNFESGPQPRYDLFTLRWAVALDNHPAPCPFSISLVPEDGPEAEVVVQTSTSDVKQGPRSGPNSIRTPPWGQSAGGPWDSFKVAISSGCTWSVLLVPLYHE